MIDAISILKENFESVEKAQSNLLHNSVAISTFKLIVDELVTCYRNGGRLYIAGNGGSAADAQHLAAEFVSKLARDRNPLPAEALTTDSSILTAIGNDYGFENIFSRQLAAKISEKDMFLGVTTSGKSLNIIKALEQCKKSKAKSIVFCGRDGGDVVDKCNYWIIAPGIKTSTIQEIHISLAHTLCECVEFELFK